MPSAQEEKFIEAAECGNITLCQEILESTASPEEKSARIFAKGCFGNTAMHTAARSGHANVVGLLLSQASGTEEKRRMLLSQNNHGATALMLAADYGHENVARVLLSQEILESTASPEEKSALIFAKNGQGTTAMHLAARMGHANVVGLLLSQASGTEEKRRMLLSQNNAGFTALMFAALTGEENVARVLLSQDAAETRKMLLLQDNEGKTAADYASAATWVLAETKNAVTKILREAEAAAGKALEVKKEEEEKGPKEEEAAGGKAKAAPGKALEVKKKGEEKGPKEEKDKVAGGKAPDVVEEATALLTLARAMNRWGIDIANVLSGTHTFFPKGFIPTHNAEECLKHLSFKGSEKVLREAVAASTMEPGTPPGDVMVIHAYTLESELYGILNTVMRHTDEELLAHWTHYIYHVEKALSRRPVFVGVAYRGIKVLVPKSVYEPGTTVTWQSFSSATKNLFCVLEFLDRDGSKLKLMGTVFVIKSQNARCIWSISAIPGENEVVFGANTHFLVEDMVREESGKRELLPQLEDYNVDAIKVFTLKEL